MQYTILQTRVFERKNANIQLDQNTMSRSRKLYKIYENNSGYRNSSSLDSVLAFSTQGNSIPLPDPQVVGKPCMRDASRHVDQVVLLNEPMTFITFFFYETTGRALWASFKRCPRVMPTRLCVHALTLLPLFHCIALHGWYPKGKRRPQGQVLQQAFCRVQYQMQDILMLSCCS